MLDYVKRYAASVAYFFVFGLLALLSSLSCIGDENSLMKTVASSSLANLFISFYCASYFILYYAARYISLLPLNARESSCTHSAMMPANACDESPCACTMNLAESGSSNDFFYQSAVLWYHVYSFGFAVFCLTYSLTQLDTNASSFLCMGSCMVSMLQPHVTDASRVPSSFVHSLVRNLKYCIFTVYFICFTTWMYHYHIFIPSFLDDAMPAKNATLMPEFADHQSHFWRNIWFQMIAPLSSPFFIICFKEQFIGLRFFALEKKKGQGGEGTSAHVLLLFSLPLLALLSMFFLTLFMSLNDNEMSLEEDFLHLKNSNYPAFTILQVCVIHPCCLFLALVIFIGGIGKTKYSMLCSSSLTLIFFIFSNFNLPLSIRNNNIIMPCLVMSLLGFFLSLLILVINVYSRECEMQNDVTAVEEEEGG